MMEKQLVKNKENLNLFISPRTFVELLSILAGLVFLYKWKAEQRKLLKDEQEHLDDNKNLGIFFTNREQEFGELIKEELKATVKTIFKDDNDKISLLEKAIDDKHFNIVFENIRTKNNSLNADFSNIKTQLNNLEKSVKKYKNSDKNSREVIIELEKECSKLGAEIHVLKKKHETNVQTIEKLRREKEKVEESYRIFEEENQELQAKGKRLENLLTKSEKTNTKLAKTIAEDRRILEKCKKELNKKNIRKNENNQKNISMSFYNSTKNVNAFNQAIISSHKKYVIVYPNIVNFFNVNLYKKNSSNLSLVKYFDLETYTNQKNYKNFEIKCVKVSPEIFSELLKNTQ